MDTSIFLLFLLLIKHFIADWVLQTDEIAQKKGKDIRYLAIHCLHHSIATVVALILFAPVTKVVSVAVIEFFVHATIDWLKANPAVAKRYPMPTHKFWILIGFDQLLHQLFYILVVLYLL